MKIPYVRVWLRRDIKGKYYVGSTILEDGKSAWEPYPKEYIKMKKKWDKRKHYPFKILKRKVTLDAKKIGFGIEVNIE